MKKIVLLSFCLMMVTAGSHAAKSNVSAQANLDQALQLAIQNKTTAAKQILQKLMDSGSIDKSILHLNIGRIEYQNGKFKEAIASYEKVNKNSDYWMEALEEKAWAHLRLNEKDK